MENNEQWQDPLQNQDQIPDPFAEKTHKNAESFNSGHLISWLILSFFIFFALVVFLTRTSKSEEMDPQKFAEYFPSDQQVQVVLFSSPT